ncbi:hypothetical protein RhiirC2_793178 [Rhizophagus irregularis]|uniref:Uncharacterized protein n=1 Tax=Rhizophagus irregularis TaxID=588596 RepID=A0A2N1MFV1_9GLOM|nr:hypothetical protein RhiirC2_793178 [Rhizophagus irregularis]
MFSFGSQSYYQVKVKNTSCILLVEKLLVKKTKKTQKTLSKSKNNSKLINILEALSLQELFLMQCDKDKDKQVGWLTKQTI